MHARGFLLLLTWLLAGPTFGAVAATETIEDRLAIKGYDPVAYFTEGRPMVGDPQFEYKWDDAIYRFASLHHLELFKGDPDRYVPQHGNWCTAALSRGVKVVADPNNWIIHDDRLYVFGKPIGPGILSADPVGVKARAEKNWARFSELPFEPQQ